MIPELFDDLSHQILAFFLKVILHLLSFIFQGSFKLHDHELGFQLQLLVVELKRLLGLLIFFLSLA